MTSTDKCRRYDWKLRTRLQQFQALVLFHFSCFSSFTSFLYILQVEDLFLLFAKKASAFNSWFENAEEDLTDPVRCNSIEEIRVKSNSVCTVNPLSAIT